MSAFNRVEDIVRNCDTAYLDEHWEWDADPHQIAAEVLAEHRAEVLSEVAGLANPKKPEVSFFGQYGPQVAWWLRMLVGGTKKATAAAATATPDFFQVGHTYAREHHASTIRFLVRYIDDSPEGIPHRVAFGWRTEDGDVCASPPDSDDFTGWIDVTEAGAS